MKTKTLLSILLVLTLSVAHAQRLNGIYCGVNVNSIRNENSGTENYGSLQSFHAGVMTIIPFNAFSLQTGIQLTGKGGGVIYGDRSSQGDYVVAETNPFYLEIPATFNLNILFQENSSLYIGIGPYASIGIGGTNRVYGRSEGIDFGFNESISYDHVKDTPPAEGGVYSSMNRFDYGARFNAGLLLSKLHFSVFYDLGLAQINRISYPGQNDHLRLQTLGFTAGFVFSGYDK